VGWLVVAARRGKEEFMNGSQSGIVECNYFLELQRGVNDALPHPEGGSTPLKAETSDAIVPFPVNG